MTLSASFSYFLQSAGFHSRRDTTGTQWRPTKMWCGYGSGVRQKRKSERKGVWHTSWGDWAAIALQILINRNGSLIKAERKTDV